MQKNYTISILIVKAVLHIIGNEFFHAELIQAAGIAPDTLDDPDARVPVESLCRLYEEAALLTEDENLGLRLAAEGTGEYSISGYIAMHSPTVREAFEKAIRYQSLITDCCEVRLEERGELADFLVCYEDSQLSIPRQMIDAGLSSTVIMIRRILGCTFPELAEVHFRYPEPKETQKHQELFQVPLYFGRKQNKLVFQASLLERKNPMANQSLQHYLQKQAEGMLKQQPQTSTFLNQFHQKLEGQLCGENLDREKLAQELGMSGRTLQRRLKEENTTFQGQLDLLRQKLSKEFLRRSLPISEVAFLLGFSEQSAFSRAFKSWIGISPKEYRRSHT